MEKKESSKSWERPWTTDEIRKESGNWSLAGDAGLLNHLQQFSQNLLQRTHATEVSLDKLIADMKTSSTEISNVTNTFLSLANTQFVENRVYDDDEKETPTEEKKEEEKVKPKEQQEAEVVARVKEALALGMAVLDSHFDAVEVPASDSEEDESSASTGRVILEARNPYMSRPLPYVIGSREFMEDDHVGLGDLLSDTEESPDQNLVQSSDSDMDQDESAAVAKRPRLSSSSVSENSEPESDRSGVQGKQKKHKVGSSLLGSIDALEEEADMFGRESLPEADVGAVPKRGVPNNFAEELANKLGGVAAEENKPQKQKLEKATDNLFSPPSESEEDDSLFGHHAGKFSGGRGLFDDLEDWNNTSNSLWGSDGEKAANTSKQAEKAPRANKVPPVGGGSLFSPGIAPDDLFGNIITGQVEEDDDEDDIFSIGTKSKQHSAAAKAIRTVSSNSASFQETVATSTPTSVSAPGKVPDQGLFEEGNNGSLFGSKVEPNKKDSMLVPKNTSLFDSTDLDDGDLFAIPSSSSKKEQIKTTTSPAPADTSQDVTKRKKPVGGVSVFGDVNLFHNKISPVAPRPPSTSSESETEESTKTVSAIAESSSGIGKTNSSIQQGLSQNTNDPIASRAGKISLFDNEEEQDLLFQPKFTSTRKSAKEKEDTSSDLFREEAGSDSLFEKPHSKGPKETIAGQNPSAVKAPNPLSLGVKPKKPVSLFDESDSGDDELLFSSTSSTSSRSRRSQGSGDLLATAADKKPLQKKGLFDNEDVLFGGSQQDEPGFDIFSGDNGIKDGGKSSVPKFVPEERNADGNLFGGSTGSIKKVVLGLFDEDNDVVDDIFAIPTKTKGRAQEKLSNPSKEISNRTSLKSDIFSDSDVKDSVDIFSVGIPSASDESLKASAISAKNASDIFSSSIFQDNTDDIFSSPKDVDSALLFNTTTVGSEGNSVDDSLFEKSSILGTTVTETKEKLASKVESVKVNNKPPISQKPKVTSTKPSEESDIFSASLKVTRVQETIQTESKEASEGKGETKLKNENVDPSGTNQERVLKGSVEVKWKASQEPPLITQEIGTESTRQIKDQVQSPSISKPEPPRTLNIRKTTDVLFGSSSNDEEDMFGASWTGKSSDEKDVPAVSRSLLSSDTLSAILDDYSSVPEKPSSAVDRGVDIVDGSSFSSGKRSRSEKEISHKAESGLESIVAVKAKSLEPSPTVRSPRKLIIDPTALLPGAKPPSKAVCAEVAVSFDQPADANATLHSAGKERAKIQVKRRPPSRRARQEALRVSSIDQDSVDTSVITHSIDSKKQEEMSARNENLPLNNSASTGGSRESNVKAVTVLPPAKPRKPSIPSKPIPADTSSEDLIKGKGGDVPSMSDPIGQQESPPDIDSKPPLSEFLDGNSNPLSPSTDEEDFFAVPQDLPLEYGSSKDQASDDSKNLFGGAPVLSPIDFSSRTVLYGDDVDSHSHDISSENLFLSMNQRDDSGDQLFKEPVSSSENLFPSNIPETKKDLFSGSGDRKEETSSVREYVEVRNPLDEGFRNKSVSLDDDSDDLFGSSKNASPTNTQDLFSTVKKEAITKHTDIFSNVKPKQDSNNLFSSKTDTPGKKNINLFPSAEDAGLFSSENASQKDSMKNGDNLFDIKGNSVASGDSDLLFSASKNNPKDLFSVGSKTVLSKGSTTKVTSDDLFPSNKSKDDDYDDSIFSSEIKEHRSLLQTEQGDLFASDDSQVRNIKSDLFSSRTKSHVSKGTADEENKDVMFSNKGRDTSNVHRVLIGVNTEASNLFGDDSPESDDLFASSLVTSKKKTGSEVGVNIGSVMKPSLGGKGNLFDDGGDENIFGANSAKSGPKAAGTSSLVTNRIVATTNEESDDLFSSSVSQKRSLPKPSSKQPVPAVRSKKTNKEEELFEDPLMVIKK